jgi:hypothetical protein
MGKPCPDHWRDDGTSCYPPWTGVDVALQAKKDGSYMLAHPIVVTDCSNYNQTKNQSCPVNFKNTAVCSCQAIPTSKGVQSIIGKLPKS